MKFGHDFAASLQREEYPKEWIESAVSYRRLKKCIKKVKQELDGFGLSEQILNGLWRSPSSGSNHSSWQYSFTESSTFTPKLTVAIDKETRDPVDAWLSPATRECLERVVSAGQTSNQDNDSRALDRTRKRSGISGSDHAGFRVTEDLEVVTDDRTSVRSRQNSPLVQTIEIPLTSDGEFFQVLQRELRHLREIQEKEVKRLDEDVVALGDKMGSLTASLRSKAETQAWREILQIYVDAQVFFSSREKDAGTRDPQIALRQLREFIFIIHSQKLFTRLKGRARPVLDQFVNLNLSLLQLMRFRDLNRIASEKIMKKFDKRTALRAREALPLSLSEGSIVTQALAKSACFQISQQILNLVPQLTDYSCPICLSIAYKPIRLRCSHVFCIRCLIVMQRDNQGHCPLCREESVLEANSDNLDIQLKSFMEAKFPKEVKTKHRENLRAAGIDQYGERYAADFDKRCVVM